VVEISVIYVTFF